MLPFIMFDSMPRSSHLNSFEPHKRYFKNRVRYFKKRREKREFWPLVQIFKNIVKMEYAWSGVVSLMALTFQLYVDIFIKNTLQNLIVKG